MQDGLYLINVPFSIVSALNPFTMISCLWRRRGLFGRLLLDELFAKFRHSRLGVLWLIIPQFCMLAIYAYVFGCVFMLKWPGQAGGSKFGFALPVYVGIVLYSVVADTVMGSCGAIASRANYVKRIPVPLELFPLSIAISNFLVAAVFLLIVALAVILYAGGGMAVLLFFIPLSAPLLLLAIGGGLLTSTVGVFFRDIGNLLSVLLLLLFFTAPVFYSLESIPENYRFIAYCNPLTPIIVNMRNLLVFHSPISWRMFISSWGWGIVCCQIGYFSFSFFKRRFADVL